MGAQAEFFFPAESKAEAVARLYALAGARAEPLGPGSTEKKSVLVALAHSLNLPVNTKSTKPTLAEAIAEHLGARWPRQAWSSGSTITLLGLNTLLEAASDELSRRASVSAIEAALASELRLDGFQPARGKLEAVNRIAALTHSGPEDLGPGSKERKSVLINLSRGLNLGIDTGLTKVDLGAAIASTLGVPWPASAWSNGQTITLSGLNALLAGAERRLGVLGQTVADAFARPLDEADALLAVLADAIDGAWEGRACVEMMREAEYRNWRQTEWIGWFFEFLGIPALINAFGGGPRRVLNTSFDYALRSTWDLKAHSTGREDGAILNDLDAVSACLDEHGGLGFIVLSGEPDYSNGIAFDLWHRAQRGAPPASPKSRALKSGFTPLRLEAFYLRDRDALAAATARGEFTTMIQGRQPDGSPRKPKLKVNFRAAHQPEGTILTSRELALTS